MSQMSKDITPSCPRSGTVPDCPIQGHVPSKYQHCLIGLQRLYELVFEPSVLANLASSLQRDCILL